MAAQKDVGVYQKPNGYWEYRFIMVVDGKQISKKKGTDEFGNKLKTKREAVAARAAAMVAARSQRIQKPRPARRTVQEVFAEFVESGRKDRAYQTIRKQDSLWENHLKERFGKRYVDEISVGEVNDYLAELYYTDGLSYQYTESFLKMFYLIFGQAYSRDYLDVNAYNKLCVNKNTKIRMPKMKSEDDTEIISFSKEQCALLDEYFRDTNAETAYLLGRYCGLRINECFGLKWDHVDLEAGTITIDRQMQYQDGLIRLIAPKTRNSRRTIHLSKTMHQHLQKMAARRAEDEKYHAALRRQPLCLSLGYKLCGVHTFSQKANIVQVKVSLADIEALAVFIINDGFQLASFVSLQHFFGFINGAFFLQHQGNLIDRFNVVVNGASFSINAAFLLQKGDNIKRGRNMVFIRVFQEVLQHHIGLDFLIGLFAMLGFPLFCHVQALLSNSIAHQSIERNRLPPSRNTFPTATYLKMFSTKGFFIINGKPFEKSPSLDNVEQCAHS